MAAPSRSWSRKSASCASPAPRARIRHPLPRPWHRWLNPQRRVRRRGPVRGRLRLHNPRLLVVPRPVERSELYRIASRPHASTRCSSSAALRKLPSPSAPARRPSNRNWPLKKQPPAPPRRRKPLRLPRRLLRRPLRNLSLRRPPLCRRRSGRRWFCGRRSRHRFNRPHPSRPKAFSRRLHHLLSNRLQPPPRRRRRAQPYRLRRPGLPRHRHKRPGGPLCRCRVGHLPALRLVRVPPMVRAPPVVPDSVPAATATGRVPAARGTAPQPPRHRVSKVHPPSRSSSPSV